MAGVPPGLTGGKRVEDGSQILSFVRFQTVGDGGPPPDSPVLAQVDIGGGRRAYERKGTGSKFPDRDGGTHERCMFRIFRS